MMNVVNELQKIHSAIMPFAGIYFKDEREGKFSSTSRACCCAEFYNVQPRLQPNKITDDEVKNKSSIELRLTEPMLIANKKMRIYSSASIEANPMLYLLFLFCQH